MDCIAEQLVEGVDAKLELAMKAQARDIVPDTQPQQPETEVEVGVVTENNRAGESHPGSEGGSDGDDEASDNGAHDESDERERRPMSLDHGSPSGFHTAVWRRDGSLEA